LRRVIEPTNIDGQTRRLARTALLRVVFCGARDGRRPSAAPAPAPLRQARAVSAYRDCWACSRSAHRRSADIFGAHRLYLFAAAQYEQ